MEVLFRTMKDLKEFTTQELEAESLKKKRDQHYRDIVALRNQLFKKTQESVEYDPKDDLIMMKKRDYDILVRDWENTTNT